MDGNGFMLGRKQFNDQRAKKRFSRKYNDIEVETGTRRYHRVLINGMTFTDISAICQQRNRS